MGLMRACALVGSEDSIAAVGVAARGMGREREVVEREGARPGTGH